MRTASCEEEITRLKNVVSSIDQERDVLQQEVDNKAEELVNLDEGLRQQEKADTELKLSLEELEENLRYVLNTWHISHFHLLAETTVQLMLLYLFL